MRIYTGKGIEIPCGECSHIEGDGLDFMIVHILQEHPAYTAEEAAKAAERWLEDAAERHDEWLQSYYDEQKLDRAIERDAFPNK